MRLSKGRLRNFRCYKNETSFDIDDLTVFAGRNDVGKSAIFDALNIFFDEGKIDADDPCVTGNKNDVRIICEFEEFPDEIIIDADYRTSLEKEYLLNAEGRLEIHKQYDGSLKNPKLKTITAMALHPVNDGCSDLLLLKNKDLKDRANSPSLNVFRSFFRINDF